MLANLEEEAGQRAVALAANFEFSFMTAETYIRVNKGVLVIVLFASFRDQSGRSSYVNREFFLSSGLKSNITQPDRFEAGHSPPSQSSERANRLPMPAAETAGMSC